jgi:uroporphyrinogen decarboxylase
MDLIIEPAIAEAILEHIAAYYFEYNRRVFEAADGNIDIFFMGDDMGTQNSTWVPVEMYRKFFKKRFTQFNELAHGFGIKTMYHTCGKVTDFIPEFVDAGLDILQSLQPGAMSEDYLKIKQGFGKNLCFQGGIDIQHILPQGSPEDIRQHVKETVNTLGSNGGYIFGTSHNLLPETPTENILALIEAYHEFG